MNINLTKAEKIKLLNSDDIYSIMQKVLLREEKIDQNKEHFWILGLALNNRLQFIELVSLGTVKATLVEPMEVFSLALQKQANKIILCHNHPSGELKPSQEDQDITNRLIQVGQVVKIPVLDHLIISDISFLSFEDIGLLAVLEKSTKYVPGYVMIERIKAEAAALVDAAEKASNEKVRFIALKLKEGGMEANKIASMTGLSIEEIARL